MIQDPSLFGTWEPGSRGSGGCTEKGESQEVGHASKEPADNNMETEERSKLTLGHIFSRYLWILHQVLGAIMVTPHCGVPTGDSKTGHDPWSSELRVWVPKSFYFGNGCCAVGWKKVMETSTRGHLETPFADLL